MKRAIIVSGGECRDSFVLNYVNRSDFSIRIAADKGLEFFARNGIAPTHMVGDFDSVDAAVCASLFSCPEDLQKALFLLKEGDKEQTFALSDGAVVVKHPSMKDATDTELAVDLAIREGAGEILLMAATGSRVDHTMANIGTLIYALQRGADCRIVDSHNAISVAAADCEHPAEIHLLKKHMFGNYVSLLPWTAQVKGLTLSGFRYPLQDASLSMGSTLGISNEVTEEVARIAFREGILIIVEALD